MNITPNSNRSDPKLPPQLAYKIADAARLLGVSVVSLRRCIGRGLLKPVRAFRHVLITHEELQRFLATTTSDSKGGAK